MPPLIPRPLSQLLGKVISYPMLSAITDDIDPTLYSAVLSSWPGGKSTASNARCVCAGAFIVEEWTTMAHVHK